MAEKMFGIKRYQESRFQKMKVVLKEISLSIDKGEFITLLGFLGMWKRRQLCVS